MGNDLNKIYSEAGTSAGAQEPDPLDPRTFLNRTSSSTPNMPFAGQSFSTAGVSKSDKNKFFGDYGLYDPALTGRDIVLEAGKRQTFGSKLTRRIGNLIPNVAANIIDMAASVGSLLTEFGDERDYHNGLNELADSIKNPLGENYKRNNDTWAIGDPTWWIDNAFNTIEYAAAYGIGGVGIAKGFGAAVKGIDGALQMGAKGTQWLNKAAELGTSAFVSYAQGAQDGASVFKEVYDNQLMKAIAAGQSPEEAQKTAKHIAAESAATTAQLSTMLTMGINSGAYAPMFRSQETLSRDIIASRLMGLEHTSFGAIGKTIRSMNATDFADKLIHNQGIKGVLNEMWREGGEEVLQQFAQRTGSDIGNKGKIKGFVDQFGELENLVDRSANSEGLFAFTLGAAFGGLQHGLIHNVIPSKRVDRLAPDGTPIQKFNTDGTPSTDKEGKPISEKRWVTPRTYEKDFTQKAFNTVRDAVAHDLETTEQLKTDFLAARKAGNKIKADEIRDEMFNAGKLYAVKAGMIEPWTKTFETIANLDRAAAVQASYALDENDTVYKEKAQEAMTDLKHLDTMYKGLQSKYGMQYESNQNALPLVDMVFARQADLYSTKKRIDRYEKETVEAETEESRLATMADPEGYNTAVSEYIKQHNSSTAVNKMISEDAKTLKMAAQDNDMKSIDRILKKYRAIGFGTDSRLEAIRDLSRKLKTKQEQTAEKVVATETALLNGTDYSSWVEKNPGKSFDEYLAEVNKRTNLNVQNRYRRSQLEETKVQYEIAQKNLSEMTQEKNLAKFSKKAEEWRKQMTDETEAIQKEYTKKLAQMTKDKSTLSRLEKIGLNKIADKHKADRDAIYERIAANEKQLEALKKELAGIRRDPLRALSISRIIKKLNREQKLLTARAKVLDSLYNEYKVDETPSTETIAAEEVTGEENGKTVFDSTETATTGTSSTKNTSTVPSETDTLNDMNAALAEIDAASGAPVILEAAFSTIDDELAAMEREILADVNLGSDPFEEYSDLYNAQQEGVQRQMDQLINKLLQDVSSFSLDYLNVDISLGEITKEDAYKLLIAARDYVQEVQRLSLATDTQVPVVEATEPSTLSITVVPIAEPDTPIIDPDAFLSFIASVPESPAYHAGYKIIPAAMTGAVATIGYEEGTRKDAMGRTIYIKVTKPQELNKELNEDILKHGMLNAGHPLRYEVDIEYEGPALITDGLSWDEDGNAVKTMERGADYLGANGRVKIDMLGNVPIRVMDATTGKYLFHIRKMDWINAKYPNTVNHRNVVERTEDDPDNIGTQRILLHQLREQIVTQFNANGKAVEGKIDTEGKGTGRLILNHVVTNKTPGDMNIKSSVVPELAYNKKSPEKSMLPEELELVIVTPSKSLNSGKDYKFNKKVGVDPKSVIPGAIGAMVRAANGEYMFAPLSGMKLVEPGKPSPALLSVVRAIELFILNDGSDSSISSEIQELEKNTNFNVGTAQGLRAFINQYYTYSQNFEDSALSPNSANAEKTERFVFTIDDKATEITDKTKQIKIGFTVRGDGVQYANLTNGALSPSFVNMLAEGFSQRARAVVYTDPSLNIKGINSRGMFTDAMYNGTEWKHNTYDNYNQYVKSFSKTPVYGRNQLSDGTYVYTANPQLPITSPLNISPVTPVVVTPNMSPTVVAQPDKDQVDMDVADFMNLGNSNYARSPLQVVKALGTGSDNSIPLTLAALEEKYNFTPTEQRNGKTVKEVLADLTGRGHTYLSDGYNPFSRCM